MIHDLIVKLFYLFGEHEYIETFEKEYKHLKESTVDVQILVSVDEKKFCLYLTSITDEAVAF